MDYTSFGFAARIFTEFLSDSPTPQTLETLKQQGVLKEWFIHSQNESGKVGKVLWKKAHEEEIYDEIAADYTQLFICDEESLKAPPYASYYLDQSGETYTQESDATRVMYQKFGFYMPLMKTEPSDHVAIELAFLSILLKSYEANKIFDEPLKFFIATHLSPWIFAWCQDVQKNAKTNFYRGIGYLLEELMDILVSNLHIIPMERTIYRHAS